MIKNEIRSQYTVTIGIECHVQLKTKTKLFAAISNDAREAKPNSLISHICLGMPGALPYLNKRAVELASMAAFALGTKPQKFSKFDRKHYFYPDLPKGYQISQFDQPIILGGHVDIEVHSQKKRIGITRAHLEEDAGKSTHPAGKDYSLVDLNRAGTPLLEIVSEPDMHSAAEAKAYAKELYLLMKYAKVSDVDLYHGNMRFDVNVSVSKTNELGTRTETKNLNSFKSIEKAVEYEVDRQIELLEKGEKIVQETRGWDDAKQKTFSQRTKEDAHDYRYSPDPDLPPIVIDDSEIKEIEKTMPLLPEEVRSKLAQSEIERSVVETIIEYPGLIERLFRCVDLGASNSSIKRFANWFANEIIGQELLRNPNIDLSGSFELTPSVLAPEGLVYLDSLIQSNKISTSAAKSILIAHWTDLVVANIDEMSRKFEQVSDEGALDDIVKEVIKSNPQAAEDVKNGEMKAIGFLVGQAMKASQGKANPGMLQQIIKKQLGV